jgi:hypothetical protein
MYIQMEFIYKEDYMPIAHCGKQSKMKLVGDSIYLTLERYLSSTDITTKNIKVHHIRKPTYMSLCENSTYTDSPEYKGQGHFSIIQDVQCHPKSYMDIMNKIFHIPDFFDGGNVLTLSNKIITIWDEGLEVHNTSRLTPENITHIGGIGGGSIHPIRFFLAKNNINSVEGTGRISHNNQDRYKIYINEYSIPVTDRNATYTAISFTNEEEYKKTLDFLIDNLFSDKKSTDDLFNVGETLI